MDNPLSPSGHPEQVPFDRSTAQRLNVQLLAGHLRHDLEEGDIKATDVAEWLTKPWTAINFLEGRVSSKKESIKANPYGLPPRSRLDTLRAWAEAADKGESERIKWEKKHPDEVVIATNAVKALNSALAPTIKMFESTEKSLNIHKGLNTVEDVLRGTKEYVWDEFWDHPEMSAGLVVLTFLTYGQIKGTKLWSYVKMGAAATVAGAFLKNKFGVQPVEKLAEVAERLGQQEVADGIRKTRDTIKRGLFGAEGEGDMTTYYVEELGFHRYNEQIAFRFLFRQNPKKFVEWYNSAKKWMQDRKGGSSRERVPSDVAGLVREMGRGNDIPPHFKKLSDAQKVELLVNITDGVLGHLAKQNPIVAKPLPGTGKEVHGLAVLQMKYINGKYFDLLWDKFEAKFSKFDKYDHPEIRKQVKRILASWHDFYKGMSRRVRHGSDVIDFQDVLMLEADIKDITDYTGLGMSGDEFMEPMKELKKTIVEASKDGWKKAVDMYNELDKAIPDFPGWKKVYEDYIKPLGEDGKWPKETYDYFFEDDPVTKKSRFDEFYEDAKAKGGEFVELAKDNPITNLVKEAGLQTKEMFYITMQELDELRNWLEEQRKMGKVLRTLKVGVDNTTTPNRGTWSLGSDDVPLLQGYTCHVTCRFVPEEDPAHPPPAGSTLPPAHEDKSTIPLTERTPFKNVPLVPVRANPAPYIYRYFEVEVEMRTPVGHVSVARKRTSRKIQL